MVQATMVRDRQHGPVVELNRIQVTVEMVLSLTLLRWGGFIGSHGPCSLGEEQTFSCALALESKMPPICDILWC